MKNYKLFLLVLVISSLYYCSEDTVEFEGKGTINGIVVAKDTGDPLSDVKITTSPASSTVFTDSIGAFTLTDVIQNTYAVEAELDGYITSYESVTVTENTVSNVAFELSESNLNNVPPLTPELVFPEDGAMALDLEVAFIWDSSDADGDEITYTFDLRNGTTNEMMFFEVGTDTTLVVSDLQLATNYFWQVTASDDINDPVSSTISEFSTITELGNPFLFVKKVDGNNVIYSGSEELDEIDVNLIPLTESNTNSFKPRRNLTVERIAFLRTVGGNTQLFTMNFDGTDVDQVTANVPVSGFRDDQLNFTWAQDGQLLYYPHFNKIYQIDADGGGSSVIYQTFDGSLISEIDVPEFDNDLMVVKTNNFLGYDVRIFTIRISTGEVEDVVFENTSGAVGGVSFDANATRVLYSWDVTGSQNQNYRIFESRIFIFDLLSMTSTQIVTEALVGENDLDARFWPSEGGVILMRKTSNPNGVPSIFKADFNPVNTDIQLFTEAFMPDWE